MRMSPPLFTYWLALCGRPWWEQQAAFNVWSHFAEKESCHWESSGRVWRRDQWRDTRKTNLIFCSRAWNRTLMNLKLSIQRDCCRNCSHLCFCFFFFLKKNFASGDVRLNWTLHRGLQDLFTLSHRWWKRSEWLSERERAHEGFRNFIYDPSHILMQPLCSKRRPLI